MAPRCVTAGAIRTGRLALILTNSTTPDLQPQDVRPYMVYLTIPIFMGESHFNLLFEISGPALADSTAADEFDAPIWRPYPNLPRGEPGFLQMEFIER